MKYTKIYLGDSYRIDSIAYWINDKKYIIENNKKLKNSVFIFGCNLHIKERHNVDMNIK